MAARHNGGVPVIRQANDALLALKVKVPEGGMRRLWIDVMLRTVRVTAAISCIDLIYQNKQFPKIGECFQLNVFLMLELGDKYTSLESLVSKNPRYLKKIEYCLTILLC